jgi:hypothetical protein
MPASASSTSPDFCLVNIDLDARIDSVNGGIRNTFETVPDAPQCSAKYSESFCKKLVRSLKLKIKPRVSESSQAVSSTAKKRSHAQLASYHRAQASKVGFSGSTSPDRS